MKIKINREIEIPDSMSCQSRGKKCIALGEIDTQSSADFNVADCGNFNQRVFGSKDSGWAIVKCRACIDATLDYLNGVTK
jgi:hypothetical protein